MASTLTPEEHELWRLTMEHSPVGMALMSPDGRYLQVNPALCQMLGRDRDDLLGLTYHHVTHPDDLLDGVQLHQALLTDTTSAHRARKRYLRPDGTVVPVDLSMVLHRDDDGTPLHFMTQVVDLSEKHAAEARIGMAERQVLDEQLRTRTLLDIDVVGLCLIDLDGQFQAVNATQQRIFDLAFPGGHTGRVGSRGHVYDADQVRLLHPTELPSTRAAQGEEFDNYLCWAGPDRDARRALVISARNIPDADGRRVGSAMVFHDVTEMMRAVRAKDEFVASVSHELRTPLTSALGNLELLHEADLAPDRRRQVEVALRSVVRLSHLVADVLLASQAMAGSELVNLHDLDLVRVARDAVAAADVEASATGVDLVCDVPATLPWRADGLRLRQALDNLLANAVTHTPGGRVTLRVEEHDGEVEITVSDTGEGLEAVEVHQMFDRFFRGANARRRHLPGVGLGLSIVRTIVEAHGGTVSATSSPGAGTEVRLSLPR